MLEKGMRITTLLAWIIVFAWLLQRPEGSDTRLLASYLNPKLWWLVSGGMWMAILLLAATILRPKPHQPRQHFPLAALGQNIILLLPLLFFPLAQNKNLSAAAFSNRLSSSQLGLASPAQQEPTLLEMAEELSRQLGAPAELAEQEKAVSQEVPLSQLMLSPEKYSGKVVTVSGMVHRDETTPASSFLCLRLIMTCCIADARPVGAMVTYSGEHPLPAPESWVRVQGRFQMKPLNDINFPFIEAVHIEAIDQPKFPYLFM